MKISKPFLAIALCFLLYPVVASGQQAGTVMGRVIDDTGSVLPGASVTLDIDTDQLFVVTDENGEFHLDNVPAGSAELAVRLINFSTFRSELQVINNDTVTVNISLTLGMTADVVVTGSRTFRNITELENPRENLVGIATSASVGAITAEQLVARPIMRPGEVLEAVPGFITSQHSGEGKANQYYLRGFNLDHGSDFSTTIAGTPMNESSGAHAHGYSDVNLLIPELVSSVQYTKGPYFAEHGDFAAAGSATINYVNVLDQPLVSVSAGGHGWGRIFGASSPKVGSGNMLVALELGKNNGPWTVPDDMRKINGLVRYSQGNQRNGFSITAMGYSANWHSTDQIPQRAVTQGLIPRLGAIDQTDGGRSSRYSLAFDFLDSRQNYATRITAYTIHGGLNLFQNFTYFLNNPVNGDQVEQEGRRWTSGGHVTHRRLNRIFNRSIESAIGVSLRNDSIGTVGLYDTVQRRRTNTIRNDVIGETAVSFFGQAEIEWARKLRTTLGIRSDLYRYDVTALRPFNTGAGTTGIVSPKVTAVIGPWGGSEFYLNYGTGFHSNDARGATTTRDPTSGTVVTRDDPLVPARGAEVGFRTIAVPGLQSTFAAWYLGFDSELIFVGDAGIAEASRPSRRYGVEWTNYLKLKSWLTVELDMSFSHAEFVGNSSGGNYIPGALDRVVAGAITVTPAKRVFGSVRLRHFGPRPLIADGSFYSKPTTILNGELGWAIHDQLNITLEGFNLFDSQVSDIDYYYTSRLLGEPAGGVDDIHLHPSLPRTLRLQFNVLF